jgi:hypothetical protein
MPVERPPPCDCPGAPACSLTIGSRDYSWRSSGFAPVQYRAVPSQGGHATTVARPFSSAGRPPAALSVHAVARRCARALICQACSRHKAVKPVSDA